MEDNKVSSCSRCGDPCSHCRNEERHFNRRLLLGRENPQLLVKLNHNFYIENNRNDFLFWVINGNWEGRYINGIITIYTTGKIVPGFKVLEDRPEKLTGTVYEIFERFEKEKV